MYTRLLGRVAQYFCARRAIALWRLWSKSTKVSAGQICARKLVASYQIAGMLEQGRKSTCRAGPEDAA